MARRRPVHDVRYDAGWDDGYLAGWQAGASAMAEGQREGWPGIMGPSVPHRASRARKEFTRPKQSRPKRRKTKYQSAYSAAYKRLKKKHPRMSFGSLSKKAHAAARKKVK